MSAGKGDRPRRVNGTKYRDNYDNIKWSNNELRTKVGWNSGEDGPPQGQGQKQNNHESEETGK